MQGTADFDDSITNTLFEETNEILYDPTALHTTIYMLDTDTTAGKLFIGRFLRWREDATTRFLLRCEGLHIREFKAKKAAILQ